MINKSTSKSILVAVQSAATLLESKTFNDELVGSVIPQIDPIINFFNLTPFEAVLMGFFMNCSLNDTEVDRELVTKTFAKDISCLPDVLEKIEELTKRKLVLKVGEASNKHAFKFKQLKVNPRAMRAILNGDPELMKITPCDNFLAFLDDINDLIVQRIEKHITTEQLNKEIELLVDINKELDAIKWIKSKKDLESDDLSIFLNICVEQIRGSDEVDCDKVIREVIDNGSDRLRHKSMIKSGNHLLVQNNYIETCGGFFMIFESVKLTDETMKNIFGGCGEQNIKDNREFKPRTCKLIYNEKICRENLFYNYKEGKSVETLSKLLLNERYNQVVEQMNEKNMRPGFTVLLYGSPGTGKTSTAKNIAKITGRNIMIVDIPKIQNKWVGESEKNLARIFSEYSTAKSKFDKAPILLFNEADALLGKRINANTSIDQLNNTMQNILLQELEDFEGIFMATTNLIKNLDTAFDRRFLYKIEFQKPDKNISLDILKSSLPEVDENILDKLNGRYELTGGQISNISKKLLVNQILHHEEALEDQLTSLCEEEISIRKSSFSNPIGFKTVNN
jgi:hypothetical protein